MGHQGLEEKHHGSLPPLLPSWSTGLRHRFPARARAVVAFVPHHEPALHLLAATTSLPIPTAAPPTPGRPRPATRAIGRRSRNGRLCVGDLLEAEEGKVWCCWGFGELGEDEKPTGDCGQYLLKNILFISLKARPVRPEKPNREPRRFGRRSGFQS